MLSAVPRPGRSPSSTMAASGFSSSPMASMMATRANFTKIGVPTSIFIPSSPCSMAGSRFGMLASTALLDSPSATMICSFAPLRHLLRIRFRLSSSSFRPRSGRVRYSSLLSHIDFTLTMLYFAGNSSGTSPNTESCATAWSARNRSQVSVNGRVPQRQTPIRAGVVSFISSYKPRFCGSGTCK